MRKERLDSTNREVKQAVVYDFNKSHPFSACDKGCRHEASRKPRAIHLHKVLKLSLIHI